jgi:hypothetical protein
VVGAGCAASNSQDCRRDAFSYCLLVQATLAGIYPHLSKNNAVVMFDFFCSCVTSMEPIKNTMNIQQSGKLMVDGSCQFCCLKKG